MLPNILKIFFFLSFLFPVFPQCLSYNATGNNCVICSQGYYQNDLGSCVPLLLGSYSANVIITLSSSSFSSSFWHIYSDLGIALKTEDNLSKIYSSGKLNIYLSNETHFLLYSNSYDNLFRYNTFQISLAPLLCNESISTLCLNKNDKATIFIKTGLFSIFVSGSLYIQNIIFDGSDMVANSSDTCFLNGFCCNGSLLTSCLNQKMTTNDLTNPSTFGFFNVESRLDNKVMSNLTIINCEFLNFYAGLTNSYFNTLISVNDLPSYIDLANVKITNFYLRSGFFSVKNTNSSQEYSFINNLSNIITQLNFSNSLISFKNMIFAGISNMIKKSSIILNTQDLSQSFPFFLLFNVSFCNTSYVDGIQLSPFLNLDGLKSLSTSSSLSFYNISNAVLISAIHNSVVTFSWLAIQFCNYSLNVAISVISSQFKINKGIIDSINPLNKNSNQFIILTNSLSYLQGLTASNIMNFTLISASNTNLYLNDSFFSNYTIVSQLLSVSNGIFCLDNFTLIKSNYYSSSYSTTASLIVGVNLNLSIFQSNFTACNIGNGFNLQSGNLFIYNTSFFNFNPYYLIQANVIVFVFHNTSWSNSKATQMYINQLSLSFTINFNITNCSFVNLTSSGAFFIRNFNTLLYFYNTTFLNFSMGSSVRSFIKNDYSAYILENCLFKNMGFIGDTAALTKNYDKSLFTLYIGASFYALNVTFITNGVYSLRGGFVDTYTTTANITILNSTFIIASKFPSFSYHGLILYSNPSIYIANCYFEGFVCPQIPSDILHDYGSAINIVGTLALTPTTTNFMATIVNCTFKNNLCRTGGALNCVNIDKIMLLNNNFYNNSANQSGGHISLFYGSSAFLQENTYLFGSGGQNGGSIGITSITNVSLIYENLANSNSILSGGFIYFSFISLLNISNSNFIDGLSGADGGCIYLYRSDAIFYNLSFQNISNLAYGGVIFLSTSSNIIMTSITSSHSQAYQGGFLFAKNSDYIEIFDLYVIDSHSNFNGAVIFIDQCLKFQVNNVSTINCSSITNGIICLQEPRNPDYELKNIYCKGNNAILGSCVFAYSNANFDIENIIIENSNGNVLYFFSLGGSSVYLSISSFTFRGNNLEIDFNSMNLDNLIEINDFEFTLANGEIFENLAHNYLIEIISSFGNIHNISSLDIFCFTQESGISIFSVSDTILKIENCNFSKNPENVFNGKISRTALGYFDNSEVAMSKVNAFQNEHYLDGLLIIVNSNFSLKSCNFSENMGQISGVLSVSSSNLNIFNCIFYGNWFNLLDDPRFTDIGLPTEDGANDIFISNSNFTYSSILIIQNSTFQGSKGLFIKVFFLSSINLTNSSFIKNKSSNNISIMAGIVLFEINDLFIERSNFENLFGTVGAGLLYENEIFQGKGNIQFKNLIFNGCTASASAAFYIKNFNSFSLQNSTFKSNHAIFPTRSSVYTITQNGIGGVSVLECLKSNYLCELKLLNIVFINNSASLFAPTFFSKIPIVLDSSLIFRGNFDGLNVTNTIISYPFQITSKKLKNYTIVSGVAFSLEVEMVDSLKHSLIFPNGSRGQVLGTYKDQNLNFINDITKCQFTECNFEGLTLNQKPDSYIKMKIEVQVSEFLFSPYDVGHSSQINLNPLEINAYVRPCLVGEILQNDLSCFLCPPGTFSLNDPMEPTWFDQKCQPCIQNAICIQGNLILPLQGYWRINENSTTIVACKNIKDCLGNNGIQTYEGGANNLSQSQLATGICFPSQTGFLPFKLFDDLKFSFLGNLCFECIQGFARLASNDNCQDCEAIKGESYAFLVILMILIFGYITYTVKIHNKLFSQQNVTVKVLLKILVNHLQQMAMITLLDLHWSLDIKGFFNFLQLFSFLSDDLFTGDCLLGKIGYNIYIMKVVFVLLLPILLSFLFLIVIFILFFVYLKILKRFLKFSEKIWETLLFLIVSIFLFYPQIVRMCFSLINCETIDASNNTQVMVSYPQIECWTSEHLMWITSVSVSGLFIWGAFVPIVCFFFLYQNRTFIKSSLENDNNDLIFENKEKEHSKVFDKLHVSALKTEKTPQIINLLSFFFKGYKKNYYYWEIVIFMKKLVLTFLINLTGSINTEAKIILIAIYFVIIIMLNLKCLPYQNNTLNDLDTASIFNAYLTANIGIFFYSSSFVQANMFFLFLIVLSNSSFLLFWLYLFVKNLDIEKIKMRVRRFINEVCILIQKFNNFYKPKNQKKKENIQK